MIKGIRRHRLDRVIEAYGADPNRWSALDRRDLEALFLQQQAMGHNGALIASAQALDRALDHWPEQSTRDPEETVAWVLAHAESSTKPRPSRAVSGTGGLGDRLLAGWLPTQAQQIWRPATLGALLLALGFGLGQGSTEHWCSPLMLDETLDWSVLEKSAFRDVFEETDHE